MSNDESPNNVNQNNIAANGDVAGRDINKTIYNESAYIINLYLSGNEIPENILEQIQQSADFSKKNVNSLLKKGTLHHLRINYNESLLFDACQVSLFSKLFSDINEEYENIVLGNSKKDLNDEYLKSLIRAAGVCIKRLDFKEANLHFKNALSKLDIENKIYTKVYKEYLVSGFIHYSRQNDMEGLRSLLRTKRPVLEDDASIDYTVANIFQEICSRDTSINNLESAVTLLERIYEEAPISVKPSMANSLGLAYRRLGERTDIKVLEHAITLFEEGLSLNKNKTMEAQLKDQLAITKVRVFEFTNDIAVLQEAERLLLDCLKILESIHDPRDFKLKPRVLNNIGNIYKQRVLVFEDFKSAAKAITYYEEAEKIWNEKDAPYEWGLVKKNLGETKYALGKTTNDSTVLFEALNDCIESMKYRDLANSPYQWAKSVEIIFMIVISLNKMNSLQKMKSGTKKKIRRYIVAIQNSPEKWDTHVFIDFIKNTNETNDLLSQSY